MAILLGHYDERCSCSSTHEGAIERFIPLTCSSIYEEQTHNGLRCASSSLLLPWLDHNKSRVLEFNKSPHNIVYIDPMQVLLLLGHWEHQDLSVSLFLLVLVLI